MTIETGVIFEGPATVSIFQSLFDPTTFVVRIGKWPVAHIKPSIAPNSFTVHPLYPLADVTLHESLDEAVKFVQRQMEIKP